MGEVADDSYQFWIAELKTGRIIERDLPFSIKESLRRALQGFGTGGVQLPVLDPGTPAEWEQLILPWRTLILVLDSDQRIVWAGVPINRLRITADSVDYPCWTLEGYLLRRFVPTLRFTSKDQTSEIARALAGLAGDAAGIPLQYDTPKSGVLRDREYADDENATVYNRLQELAAVENGFNWTIDVGWADDEHSQVEYTFRTGYPYLGRRVLNPDHVFETSSNIAGEPAVEDRWGENDAATHIRAIGDGEGTAKVMSNPVVDSLREGAGWPRLEERRSFTGVKLRHTIEGHASRLAQQLFGGQRVITLDAQHGVGTRLGDLTLGDTAMVHIHTSTVDLDEVMVITEWSLSADLSTYTPTLQTLEE